MGVFRVNKNKNYTVMSNVHLRDKALPLKAKGLLSLMLSLPEDWDYSMRGLAKLSADGLDSTRAAVKALERSGYVVRRQLYDSRGRFSNNEYTVFEIPQPSSPSSDLPLTGKPSTEKSPSDAPLSEKPSQINTDQVITQKRNTDLNNYQSINLDGMDRMDERSEYEEIIKENQSFSNQGGKSMAFINQAVTVLQTLVIALGAGLAVWGVVNLMEGYGNDNPGAKSQGIKQLMAGGGVVLIGTTLIPLLSGLFG